MIKVAIHQPNYCPWLGWWHKMAISDVFIILDDVQFPRGKTYTSRTQIKTNKGPLWLTVPISGKKHMRPIKDTRIAQSNWQKKHWRSIELAYNKAPYFDTYAQDINIIYEYQWENLCSLNMTMINTIYRLLKLDTRIFMASEIVHDHDATGCEKILSICKAFVPPDVTYISGDGIGSRRYIDGDLFKQEGMGLEWQDFKHPEYPQQWGEFTPYMCILDLLFNCGPASLEILMDGNGFKLSNGQKVTYGFHYTATNTIMD